MLTFLEHLGPVNLDETRVRILVFLPVVHPRRGTREGCVVEGGREVNGGAALWEAESGLPTRDVAKSSPPVGIAGQTPPHPCWSSGLTVGEVCTGHFNVTWGHFKHHPLETQG